MKTETLYLKFPIGGALAIVLGETLEPDALTGPKVTAIVHSGTGDWKVYLSDGYQIQVPQENVAGVLSVPGTEEE